MGRLLNILEYNNLNFDDYLIYPENNNLICEYKLN